MFGKILLLCTIYLLYDFLVPEEKKQEIKKYIKERLDKP